MRLLECEREHPRREIIIYALYLYFLGLSFRDTSSKEAIQPLLFEEKKEEEVTCCYWKWVQRFNPKHVYCCKRECQQLF
jgi:hypothetical protein